MKNNNLKQEIVWLINEKYGGQLARLTSPNGGDVGGLTDKAKKDITRLEKGGYILPRTATLR